MLLKENALLVKEYCLKSGKKQKNYMFKCISCEDYIFPQSGHLKNHSGKCIKCAQKGRPYEHILNELIKTCNKRKKYNVTITYDEFIEIIKDSTCHYCNKKLIFNPHTRSSNSEPVSRAYQLDRKNNNEGYSKNNVVTCCWNCNRIKSDIYSYEDFMKLSPILKEIHNKDV